MKNIKILSDVEMNCCLGKHVPDSHCSKSPNTIISGTEIGYLKEYHKDAIKDNPADFIRSLKERIELLEVSSEITFRQKR